MPFQRDFFSTIICIPSFFFHFSSQGRFPICLADDSNNLRLEVKCWKETARRVRKHQKGDQGFGIQEMWKKNIFAISRNDAFKM